MNANAASSAADRAPEREEREARLSRLLDQDLILDNLVVTSSRRAERTALLDGFRGMAASRGWLWSGSRIEKPVGTSEEAVMARLLADLAVHVPDVRFGDAERGAVGLDPISDGGGPDRWPLLDAAVAAPGFVEDKLKNGLRLASKELPPGSRVAFACDEAQNLVNDAGAGRFAVSLLVAAFNAIQREGIPFMLVLAGSNPLYRNILDARGYAERMFVPIRLDPPVGKRRGAARAMETA